MQPTSNWGGTLHVLDRKYSGVPEEARKMLLGIPSSQHLIHHTASVQPPFALANR